MGSTVCCLIASNRACVVIILRAFPKGLSCPPHNSVISFIVATSTFCFEDISVVSVLSPKKLPGVAVVYIALRGNASLFCPVVLCCVVLCCTSSNHVFVGFVLFGLLVSCFSLYVRTFLVFFLKMFFSW